jgi:hypothetical protein
MTLTLAPLDAMGEGARNRLQLIKRAAHAVSGFASAATPSPDGEDNTPLTACAAPFGPPLG